MPAAGSGVQKWVIRNNSVEPSLTVRQVGDWRGGVAFGNMRIGIESAPRLSGSFVMAFHWLSLGNEPIDWLAGIPVESADKSVFN